MAEARADNTAPPLALRVRGVGKRFGPVPALDDVSFDLHQGEILGVIGPSGGGKTTLLRCLDALVPFDRGSIEYVFSNGVVLDADALSEASPRSNAAVTRLRQEIGLVFQSLNLWEDRTVLGNVILAPMLVRNESREAAQNRATELCRQFGLEEKLHARTWQLSGGQRQRVAIIRALMMQPRLMLLDEITSALDPILTVDVMRAIRQLRAQGLTMVIVTHHIDFASQLCDRVMFLSRGRVVQIDSPLELRTLPTDSEVRRFLDLLSSAR